MVECKVLGPLEITVDDGPPPSDLLWTRSVALLVYLASAAGTPRSREHLATLLWPERPDRSARQLLRQHLSIVTRSVGKDRLHADARGVTMEPNAVRLDLTAFAEASAAADWEAAAALVRGRFLEGFTVSGASDFETWLGTERLRWQRGSVDAVLRAAESLRMRGNLDGACSLAGKARSLDPDSEIAVRASMKYDAMRGDRAAALHTFESYREALNEIGAQPERVTVRLAKQIRGDQWTPDVPLVGRDDAVRDVRRVWRDTTDEDRAHAQLIVIDAEPGFGKTRFTDEMLEWMTLDGATAMTVRCVASDVEEPWSGVVGLLRAGLADLEESVGADPDAVATACALTDEWRERFRTVAPTNATTPGRALIRILRVVSAERPVIITFDDAHWLDAKSLETIEQILRDLRRHRIVVWLNAQTEYVPATLDALRSQIGRDVEGVAITLEALRPDDLRQLTSATIPHFPHDAVDRLARRLRVDTAGIPLLAVEELRAVANGLALAETPGPWPERNRTLDQTLPSELPPNVISALRVRFRQLTNEGQQALRVLAVAGDRVTAPAVRAGTGLDGTAVTQALDELETEHWVAAEPRGYVFTAKIVRMVVLEDLIVPGQRRRIEEVLAAAGQPVR